MHTQNTIKKYKTLGSALFLSSVFLLTGTFFQPKSVYAQAVVASTPYAEFIQTLSKIEETVQTNLEIANKYLAVAQEINKVYLSALSQKMVKSAANWALTGFKGGDPFFLKNPDQFKQNISFKNAGIILARLDDSPFKDQVTDFAGTGLFSNSSSGLETILPEGVDATKWKLGLSGQDNDFSFNNYVDMAISPDRNLNPLDLNRNYAAKVYSETDKDIQDIEKQLDRGSGFLSETECVQYETVRGVERCVEEEVVNPSSLVEGKIIESTIKLPTTKLALDGATGGSSDAIIQAIQTVGSFVQTAGTAAGFLEGLIGDNFNTGEGGKSEEQSFFEELTGIGGGGGTATGTNTRQSSYSTTVDFDLRAIMNSGSIPDILYGSQIPQLNADGTYTTDNTGALTFARGRDPKSGETTFIRDNRGAIPFTEKYIEILNKEQTLLRTFPEKLKELDKCIPGADYGYLERFNKKFTTETARESTKDGPQKVAKYERYTNMSRFIQGAQSEFIQRSPALISLSQQIPTNVNYNIEKTKEIQSALFEATTVLANLKEFENNYKNSYADVPESTVREGIVRLLRADRIPQGERIAREEDKLKDIEFRLANIEKAITTCKENNAKQENVVKRFADLAGVWACPQNGIVPKTAEGERFLKYLKIANSSDVLVTNQASNNAYLFGVPSKDIDDTIRFTSADPRAFTVKTISVGLIERAGPGSTLKPGEVKYEVRNGNFLSAPSDGLVENDFVFVDPNNVVQVNTWSQYEVRRMNHWMAATNDSGEASWQHEFLKLDCNEYYYAPASAYIPSDFY